LDNISGVNDDDCTGGDNGDGVDDDAADGVVIQTITLSPAVTTDAGVGGVGGDTASCDELVVVADADGVALPPTTTTTPVWSC